MKKTLKLVLPFLLIFALVIAGYWFFFQYRADLTTGLLEKAADSQMEAGRYGLAIRCYTWANGLDPQNADIALKLAEAYRKNGNYTKTESTLVHAIYDAPAEVRLYEALSRVYVEQDKLLDAQQMLDGVSNPEALAALSAKRPAAPIVTPEAGYYSEYITVSIQCPDAEATCCCSMDGTYPALADEYSGDLTLPGGVTEIRAVAVSPEGLVSAETYAAYTVSGVVEDVTFHDAALEAATQELLHREGRTLRTDELWTIEELTLPEEIANTQDLRLYTGMNKLMGFNLGDLDYSFLADMPELRYLDLENCVVTSEALQQISLCPKLEVLILANCGISNLSPLSSMNGLRVLDLSENSISTVIPLVDLSSLDELYLGHNALTGIPILRGLKSLRVLDLSYNALEHISGLSTCTALERLNVSHNRLTALTAVSALKELVWLNASNNSLTDTTPLTPCTKLEGLIITDNKLTDVDFLSNCPNIQEVNIDYNDVVAVPAFQVDCPLETFSAAHNFLEDLTGLGGLQQLTYVNADYNNISDISVLLNCPALVQVNVYNTNVHSGGDLAKKGVVVNYTPGF